MRVEEGYICGDAGSGEGGGGATGDDEGRKMKSLCRK